MKRGLRRPAKEKGGGEGSREVIGGEERLERRKTDRKSSWLYIEHLSVIVLVCIDLMCVYVSWCECVWTGQTDEVFEV